MGRADGRDADAGAVHRAGVDLRAQARRHPPARVQGRRRRPPALAQPAAAASAGDRRGDRERCRCDDADPRRRSHVGRPERRRITSSTSCGSTAATSRALPLEERRALLRALPLARAAAPRRARSTTTSRGSARAARAGKASSPSGATRVYEHRRSPHWLKMKCEASQELVVGGFTDPQGARVGLGALLVGYFDGDDFVFAGKVGTGFDTKLLLDLRARLDALEIPTSPFTRAKGLPRLRAHWVRPRSSSRSPSSSGRCTASCGIRGCSASGPTRPRATSSGKRRDHPSRESAVPRRRHHQGRAGRVLRGDRAAACCRTSAAAR